MADRCNEGCKDSGEFLMSNFGEILQHFKENEPAENLVPLMEDQSLRNGMVAWKSVTIQYKPASECTHNDETSRWNWLWKQIEYDSNTFAAVSGVKSQDVGTLITRLIGLRLIYPDGTINRLGSKYLQAMIMEKINKKKPGRPKKDS